MKSFAGLAPPAIPSCQMNEQWSRGEHLLFWVHTGEAEVRLSSGETFSLAEGEGVWVPATIDRSMRTAPGALAFPILINPGNVSTAPDRSVPFTAPPEWNDWLIQQYVQAISPITHPEQTQADPLTIVSAQPGSTGLPARTDRVNSASIRHPRLPLSEPAQTVARELLRNPALGHTVEQWADLVACSPSALRRDFIKDTDLRFTQWRTRCRLSAACELLAAGYEIGWVADQVGFASRRGFSAAFRAVYGRSPSQYAQDVRALPSLASSRAAWRGQERSLAGLLSPHGTTPSPIVPTTHTSRRVNDFHVLTWLYRGTGHARVGERMLQRKRGDAIWLPARVENQTGTPAGSIGVPIGNVVPADAQITEPLRAHFPRSWDTYLLYCSVSAYTMLRPEGGDQPDILDIFQEQLAAERARAVPMPRNVAARTVATDFLRSLGRTSENTTVDVAEDTHEAFRRETGMSLASWRHAARMRVARDLLRNGAKPTSVARRVGYTQVSNFSRAFSRFHGMPPREYQSRELDTT